jgi:DNA-binding MarR family transcriptional regulator
MSKADFETLAHFRYQLRRYLRFSEDLTQRNGITPLQYLLMLQIKGFPGRESANVGELAERLQAKHHGVVSLISRCEVGRDWYSVASAAATGDRWTCN